jgi:thiamine biosynthesis lipoprotein
MSLAVARWRALGTGVALVVAGGVGAPARAREAVEDELAAIDLACSRFRPDSELERLNAAGGRPTAASPLLREALAAALRAARITDGLVDPTVGEALRVAGYDRDFAELRDAGPLPSCAEVRVARTRGIAAIELDEQRGTIRVAPGVRLDLGATAKALCADRAARAAAAACGRGVLVSLGGDIAVAGPAPAGGFSVRIADDHAADPDARGPAVAIESGGLATSSVTVRTWERAGRTEHHIIDPATGAPARVVWRTVSVAAASCLDANIAATAAVVLGERAPLWLAERGLPARLVLAAGGEARYVAGWPRDRVAIPA